jgi:hypothetical protein
MMHDNRKRFIAEMRGQFSETQIQPFLAQESRQIEQFKT